MWRIGRIIARLGTHVCSPVLILGTLSIGLFAKAGAQEITILRGSTDPDLSVELTNLITGISYEEPGSAPVFSVPSGPYLVRLVDGDGTAQHSEIEIIDANSPYDRHVNRGTSRIKFSLVYPGIEQTHDRCSALIISTRLALARLLPIALVDKQMQERKAANAGILSTCTSNFPQGTYGEGLGRIVSISISEVEGSYHPFERYRSVSDDVRNGAIWVRETEDGTAIECGYSEEDGPMFCPDTPLAMSPSRFGRKRTFDIEGARYWLVRASLIASPKREDSMPHWVTVLPDEAVRATAESIRSDFNKIETQARRKIKQLPVVRRDEATSTLKFLSAETSAYRTSDVEAILQDSMNQLRLVLSTPDLAGLKRYFEGKIKLISFPQTKFVDVSVALATMDHLFGLIDRLNTVTNDLAVKLYFDTLPEQATDGALLAIDLYKEDPKVIYSQGGLINLFRGEYSFCVRKEGYQPFGYVVDLVDNPGTHLVCRLKSNQESIPTRDRLCPKPDQTESRCEQKQNKDNQ